MFKFYFISAASFLLLPKKIFAQDVCADGSGACFSLESPLAGNGITSINGLLLAVLNVLLIIAVPIIVFFIIFAGFSYVTAQGNPEKIKTATRSLTYAIIGGVLIMGAVALSQILASVACEFSADQAECLSNTSI